jgi:hypothetical protein
LNSWRLEHCEVAIGNLVLGSTIRTFADLLNQFEPSRSVFAPTALIRRQLLRTLFSLLPFLFACRNCSLGYSLALLGVESFRLVLGRQ